MSNKNYKKIAIFGGSFSPIHNGHIEMVKLALKKLDIDKLIILPTFQNPLKDSSIFSPQTRLEWVKEVFLDSNIMDTKDSKENIESRFYKNNEITNLDSKKLENIESNSKDSNLTPVFLESIAKKILISDYEIAQNRAVASIESILHFKNLYNAKKIYFLIGGDNLFQLPKWKDFEKLKKVTEFVVFTRKDSINLNSPCGEKIDLQHIESKRQDSKKNIESNQKDSKKYYDFANKHNIKITLLDFNFNISSTEIRKNIESNIDFIPQKVRDSVILEINK
nr:nicotinate-nicotinamide nucleotide adenylyltransferase [Helicobacter saguini]